MSAMDERKALFETVTPATTTVVGVPMPDVAEATLGVIDLTDTGFVTDEPEVLVWLALVAERGLAW
jgi:hypothetical protein